MRSNCHIYLCRCKCGQEKIVVERDLKGGGSTQCKSCARTKHGMARTRLYSTWHQMVKRCTLPQNRQWKNYGGRGIKLCPEWLNFAPFGEWALANGWKEGLQMDRIDNDGNYEPSNVRFVTPSENCNNRRTTKMLTAFGETKAMMDWVRDPRCVVGRWTLKARLTYGWDHERAISEPVHQQGSLAR
jgi:hypothetical protein